MNDGVRICDECGGAIAKNDGLGRTLFNASGKPIGPYWVHCEASGCMTHLKADRDRLRAENTELRAYQLTQDFEKARLRAENDRLRKALEPESIGEFIDRRKLHSANHPYDVDRWSDGFRQGFLTAKEAAKDYARAALDGGKEGKG